MQYRATSHELKCDERKHRPRFLPFVPTQAEAQLLQCGTTIHRASRRCSSGEREKNEKEETWIPHYGIIVKTENQIQSNRVVSVSKVMPINGPQIEREFFTLTLKLVNKL